LVLLLLLFSRGVFDPNGESYPYYLLGDSESERELDDEDELPEGDNSDAFLNCYC